MDLSLIMTNRLALLGMSVLALAPVRLQADYRIGQAEIPQVVVHRDPAEFSVYPRHPRLFFRDTDLPVIRERIAGDFRSEWEAMRSHLERNALTQPAETFARDPYLKDWATGRNVTFVARVTGDERYLAWSRAWMKALVAAGPVGNDSAYRGRLQSLAVAYDWLYPWLDDSERTALQEALLAHIEKAWHFAEGSTNYVGGHSRWGNMTLAAGLLALVTERPELREKLLIVRDHWINGYFPLQGWIAGEGGYHMGWAYSASYLTGAIHCLWSTATSETVFFPWQARVPLFWIYGRQGDGLFPNTGDAFNLRTDLNQNNRFLLVTAAGILKDPYAAGSIRPSDDLLPEILYGDKRVAPRAPDDASAPLPLSRNFGAAGVIVARDRWDEATTLLQFRSVPFYSENHHHRDENSFTLHYRGRLAIDSGIYDEGGQGQKSGYDGVHWRNYFTRTIAHNAIVVFDPAQEFVLRGQHPVSNDGGQPFRDKEPQRLEEIQPGGWASLGGIIRYVDTPAYTYATGDATKAYDPDRVRLAQREIVYLRESGRAHPVVVVFDRVESTQGAFAKRFLLHTVNQPTVRGRLAVAENAGGRLTSLTLLPAQAKLELVGGPGRGAWVNGRNYPPGTAWVKPQDIRSADNWRLEVSPPEPQERDHFLHVLFVDDAAAAPIDPSMVQCITTETTATVRLGPWEIAFPYAAGAAAEIRRVARDSLRPGR
jgi:hypothetical protein